MASKRPDGRVEPGQRISSAFSARAWNRAQDAADVVLGAKTGATAGESVVVDRAANIALVRNSSGVPVPVGGVLSLFGSIAINPSGGTLGGTAAADSRAREFLQRPVLVGTKCTATNVVQVAIALEPVANGAIGRFAVGGMFPCKVKRVNSAHRYARGRVDDVTQLITTGCGPVKLLWVEGTDGEDKWAVGCL
jgi:hypothetical protein